jgi:hypothetical protein
VLRFEQLAGTVGPDELRTVRLSRGEGQGLDEVEEAYQVQQVTTGQPVTGFTALPQADSGGLSTQGVGITTTTYVDVGVDSNGNGRYETLQVQVGVQVVTADVYQLEGWLVDEQGELVSWAQTGAQSLGAGAYQLSLSYDGRGLADYMKAKGQSSQQFRLVALKLYSGPLKWDEINDEVDVAHTTRSYARNQFEPAIRGGILLEDYAENGPGRWTAQPPWAIVQNGTYFSPAQAWRAANANASLDIPLNIGNLTPPAVLKFRTYHKLNNSSDIGYVKVSADGNNWQTIATFSDTLASWKTQVIDLSPFVSQATAYLRFELNSAGGNGNDSGTLTMCW